MTKRSYLDLQRLYVRMLHDQKAGKAAHTNVDIEALRLVIRDRPSPKATEDYVLEVLDTHGYRVARKVLSYLIDVYTYTPKQLLRFGVAMDIAVGKAAITLATHSKG